MKHSLQFDCSFAYHSGFELDFQFKTTKSISVLFGPSGSGKTTVLELIAGLLKPSAGNIQVGDTCFVDCQQKKYLTPEKRKIGIAFQNGSLFPHMTVQQNINFGTNRGNKSDINPSDAINYLGLSKLTERIPQSLSGGEKQRVALARAIVTNPRYLLLDEPLNSVESALQESIMKLLKQINQDFEIPILLVTHNQRIVDQLAEEVFLINAGKTCL